MSKNIIKNSLDDRMLELMGQQDIKDAGLKIVLTLKDGTKRVGIYTNIVINPLNRYEFRDMQFIQLRVDRPVKGMIISMPLIHIESVEWSQA